MWILTEEYNDYDQYGEYFVHAWISKPTWDELYEVLKQHNDEDCCDHVYCGGGRKKRYDHQWYHFREFNPQT